MDRTDMLAKRLRGGWALLLGAPLILVSVPAPAAAEAPAVVVTSKPVHSLVAAVMHGIGAPSLLVDGSASPHTFALRPSQARAVHAADLFVRVSEAVEPFTQALIRNLPPRVAVVTLIDAPGVHTLPVRRSARFASGHEDHEHATQSDHAHDHDHDGADGHIWLDPDNAKAIVTAVAQMLAERDPANAARYRDNAATLTRRIDEMSVQLAAELAPVKAKPFVVFHDATQYFERRFGLDAVGAIQFAPNVPPSAKRLSEIRAAIRDMHAQCVLAEPVMQSHVVDTVIDGTGARVAVIDPEALQLEPGPDLYVTLMRNLAASIAGCLQGGPRELIRMRLEAR